MLLGEPIGDSLHVARDLLQQIAVHPPVFEIAAAKKADLIARDAIDTIYGGPKTIVDNWK